MNTETINVLRSAIESSLPVLVAAAGVPVDLTLAPATVGVRLSARFGISVTAEQRDEARARIATALRVEWFRAEERSALRVKGDHTCWHVVGLYAEKAA